MAYQLGLTGLMKFKRFITAYDNRNYEEAAKEMLDSLWAKQTPNRASELAEQMETGEFIYD
jgi:lysozyme